MKFYFFIIITLIIFSQTAYTQFKINGYIESGYNFSAHHEIDKDELYNFKNSFYTNIHLYSVIAGFKVGGNIKTYLKFYRIDNYSPFMNSYTIFLSRCLNNLEMGILYNCTHSRITDDFKNIYNGCDRKIYIKYTF